MSLIGWVGVGMIAALFGLWLLEAAINSYKAKDWEAFIAFGLIVWLIVAISCISLGIYGSH